jgi:LPXTG-site transpeptidase (sortase) family protein
MERWIEQSALLFTSFVWTVVILVVISIVWAYQDVQARWEYVLNVPPEALAQAVASPTATPQPTATPWAGPGATLTPTSTKPPTPIATPVVAPPIILPETLNADDPTPVVVANLDAQTEQVNIDPQPPSFEADIPGTVQEVPQSEPAPAIPAPPSDTLPNRLIIDSIGIDSEIVPVGWSVVQRNGQEFSVWNVAEYAVGWHKTTAQLGQSGNTVMAGHHNVYGEVFRDLVNVEVGDTVVAYAGDRKYEYEITFKTIVKEKGEPAEVRRRNAQWIAPTDDERLTFVTCWPYTNNTHRVIVVAEPA